MIRLAAGAATDVGQVRSLNEDSLLVATNLVAVADGMGGHRGGEVASALAIEKFEAAIGNGTLDELMVAVQQANSDVYAHSHSSPELTGMGTTLCAVSALEDGKVAVVNVGDSRVYLLRGSEYAQISDDHSFVESLVREGRLTRAQADVHPQRNVLTRALGIEPHVDVDGWEMEVATGDRFLLCSDGLFNEVAEADQIRILTDVEAPADAAAALVAAANAAGGRDNVTCVVLDVVEGAAGTVGAPIAVGLLRRTTAADLDETSLDQAHLGAPVLSTSTPTPAPGTLDNGGPPLSASRTGAATTHSGSRFGWRTAVFLLAILATFGGALGALGWYAKHTYFVATSDGEVVIYRGPQNGILWIEPEVFPQSIRVASIVDESQRAALERGVEKGSMAEARAYIDNLRIPTTSSESTTTTTTSTVPLEVTSTTLGAAGP